MTTLRDIAQLLNSSCPERLHDAVISELAIDIAS